MRSRIKPVKATNARGLIIVDTFFHIRSINREAKKLTSFDGMTFTVAGRPMSQILKNNKTLTIQHKGRILEIRPRKITGRPQDYYLISIDDITDTKRLKELLLCYETILDVIHEGAMISDTGGKVIYYNSELEKLEGLRREDVLGRHITEIYHETPETSEHLTVLRTSRPIPEKYQKYFTLDGREVNSVATTFPVIRGDELVAVCSVCRNITGIKDVLPKTSRPQDQGNGPGVPGAGNCARFTYKDIIGRSRAVTNLLEAARRADTSRANILVYGETGTGKEVLVQSIHNGSPGKDRPFVAVNCAAIPENLLESILFGTVKGAFTGAADVVGLFEHAGRGTLYLDEINSMSLALQAKLLRALQEKAFRRVGGVREILLECRVVSSINSDPLTCINKKMLREDLFYRISVISLYLPPLREREGDLDLFIDHFIKKYSRAYDTRTKRIEKSLLKAFHNYRWPGNIRELDHTIESMICMAGNREELGFEHIPLYLKMRLSQSQRPIEEDGAGQKEDTADGTIRTMEKSLVIDALARHSGNISRAARELGLLRQSLQYRIRKMNINPDLYR